MQLFDKHKRMIKTNTEALEVWTPAIKFIKDKESRFALLASKANRICDAALGKRERLDSGDFQDYITKRARGISDVVIPDSKIELECSYDRFKRRRSSVFMLKGMQESCIGEFTINDDHEDAQEREDDFENEEKVSKRRKNDGFDFGKPKHRSKKSHKTGFKSYDLRKRSKEASIKMEHDDKVVTKRLNSLNPSLNDGETQDGNLNNNKQQDSINKNHRIANKITKVSNYWRKRSLSIPNVFRYSHTAADDLLNLIEFQDYSKKSVLTNGLSNSHKPSLDVLPCDQKSLISIQDIGSSHRRSFAMVLDHPDDISTFLK